MTIDEWIWWVKSDPWTHSESDWLGIATCTRIGDDVLLTPSVDVGLFKCYIWQIESSNKLNGTSGVLQENISTKKHSFYDNLAC